MEKVYVRYWQPIPKLVVVDGEEFVFSVQHGVSMLLLDKDKADRLVATRGGGCCGQPQNPFRYPNQEAINVFLTGDR